MEINKQLFEDVLSGKLKGTFVLRNGVRINASDLKRNIGTNDDTEAYPYVIRHYCSHTIYGSVYTRTESDYDIIDFIPDTDMKENELKIEIPEGKIVDWDESKKQNKIVLKDKQLTYEEICEKLMKDGYCYINSVGWILRDRYDLGCANDNAAASEYQLECILAKNKLANVAKYLNDGWKPSKGDHVFTITYSGDFKNKPFISEHYFGTGENLVVFKTQKAAQQAIEILGEETIKLALEPLGI